MKNYLYKLFINSVTNYCYQNCLNYVSENTSILDVGIGNGVMMENFHDLIKSKRLNITGIDINEHSLNHCKCVIQNYHLRAYVQIQCERVENFLPPQNSFLQFHPLQHEFYAPSGSRARARSG